MALGLLTKALGAMGGGDVAKAIIGPAGNAIINGISKKYGLDMSSPTFDADAAAAVLADKQEANRFIESMRAQDVESFKTAVQDTQHARDATFGAREKMTIEHQQKVDIINLYESIAMSIGGLVLVVGALAGLVYITTIEDIVIPEWLQVLIVATITWLTKDLISQRSNFKWGSSEGSKLKSAQNAEAEKREDAIEAKRVVEQVSTQRPIHQPAQPAAPQPTEPDELDKIVHESISTTRPTSAGDSLL